MQLLKKKKLAAKTLKVGINRIIFPQESLKDIAEAITKQDILDLHREGIIQIKDKKGRKKIVKRKHQRKTGKIKRRKKGGKREYVTITRKLRKIVKRLKNRKELENGSYQELRKMIKARRFKSKRHLQEHLKE